jgi:negative regulator of flagellin synthesis FlgM
MKVSTNTDGVDKIRNEIIGKDLKRIKDTDNETRVEDIDAEDRVEISSKAFDLNALQAAAMQTPDVRTGKVTDIKNQVESGNYKISHEELAERLMEDALIA